jgi:hypothetical protein
MMTSVARVCRRAISARLLGTILGFVAALALGLGMAVTAQAQCTGFPCYHVYLNTTDGGGFDQFSTTGFDKTLPGQDTKGNTEKAYGNAQFGFVGSSTSVDVVACPTNHPRRSER